MQTDIPGSRSTSINFNGVAVDAVTYDQMSACIDEWIRDKEGRSHHIACINAYNVALSLSDEGLRSIYNGADIRGADGMPFVRWIRLFHRVPCDRLYAPDIACELAKRASEKGYTFYLYGGAPDVVVRMKAYLEERFPHLGIVGYRSPPFRPLTDEEDEAICDEINQLRPDIVLVGLGTPKQDYWIADHIYKIRGAVLVASGATFDFFGGRVRMAPRFVQRSGFEWLYRLLSRDFRRLWRRYTLSNAVFMSHFLLQVLRIHVRKPNTWARPPAPGSSQPGHESIQNAGRGSPAGNA